MIDQQLRTGIEAITSLDDIAKHLTFLLGGGIEVWEEEDGSRSFYNIRAEVERISGVKIVIRSNEHPPPHFHVLANGIDASFRIDNGAYIKGHIDARRQKVVEHYWELAQARLIKFWNDTRPGDCSVGQYRMEAGTHPMAAFDVRPRTAGQ